MKRIVALFFTVIMLLCMTLSVSANETGNTVYTVGNKTIIFMENTEFTPAQRENIANLLADPAYGVAKANVLCWLMGHDYKTESVFAITHCDQPYAPRCLEEAFLLTYCTRCEDSIVEKTGYRHIFCCPEE